MIARGVRGASAVAFSADGASAYVLSFVGCGIGVFDRDVTTGALTQKPGEAGAATKHASTGACQNVVAGDRGFRGGGVALSADGHWLFVSARAGWRCTRAPRAGGPWSTRAASPTTARTSATTSRSSTSRLPGGEPDGRNLYVGVQGGDAVAAFDIPRAKANPLTRTRRSYAP